jgi:hypothetical protein
MACDDFVLAATSSPRAYAQCLISVAEKSFLRNSLALAQAVVGRMQQTSQRVARILDGSRDGNRPGATGVWKPALGMLAAFSAVCFVSLPRAPKLVSFEDSPDFSRPSIAASARVFTPDPAAAPKLVPASFRTTTSSADPRKKTLVLTRAAKPETRRDIPGVETVALMPAKAVQPEPDFPAQTEVRNIDFHNVNDHATPPAMFLLVETRGVDRSGRMVWNVSLWRLTVFHPAEHQLPVASPAKST